jgi:hypothetical protein
MERQSNVHGPRLDDELEREVRSLTHGAPVEARVEEGRMMEDAGDGEPVPQSIVGELHDAEAGDEPEGGLSHGEVVARSELAIHLRPGIFPATRDDVLACAEEEHAPEALLTQLQALPARRYGNVQEVWEALGGKREEGSGHLPREDSQPPVTDASTPARTRMRYGFRFDTWYRLAAVPFGIGPSSAHVDIDTAPDGDKMLVARFGPWCVTTPVANVAATTITGGYAAVKTIGPPHVSLADLGLTFATNSERGLCIRFHDAVPGVVPTSLVRHPALTVTVEDVEGLARSLAST